MRYLFFIPNDRRKSNRQVVAFYRGRADHENDIKELKSGVGALSAPSGSLLSHWAYMAIASLAAANLLFILEGAVLTYLGTPFSRLDRLRPIA